MLATQFAVKSTASFWQIRIDEFSGEVCAAVGPNEIIASYAVRLPQRARDSSTILEKLLMEHVIHTSYGLD